MNPISKIYKSKFKELLNPYGFRSYQNTFFRIINDVLQTVMLRKTPYDCSVDFNIFPLALGIEDLYCEGYSISQLRDGKMQGWDWRFESSSLYHQNKEGIYETIVFNDGSVDDIANNMLSVIASYVIPIFEKGIDCKSALDELKKYEVLVYGKELFTTISSGSYWMYIKIGDYEKAIHYLQERIKERNTNPYERFSVVNEKQKRLVIAKYQYELVTSDNYQHTKLDMLLRDDIDEEIKKHLFESGDMFYANAKFTGFMPSLQKMIPTLEKEIEQLADTNSSIATELRIKEREYANKGIKDIDSFSEQIKLLMIPDVNYYQEIIKEQESKSIEYLKRLAIRIRRTGQIV